MPTRHVQQPAAVHDYATAPAASLPSLPDGKSQLESLNERVIRHYVPDLTQIVKIAPYTVVYTFSPETQQWEKSGYEGSMFLCQQEGLRSSVFVLNRKSLENFRIELKSPEDIEITSEYVILQSMDADGAPEIFGIWFYNAEGQTSREQMGAAIVDAATTTEVAHREIAAHQQYYDEFDEDTEEEVGYTVPQQTTSPPHEGYEYHNGTAQPAQPQNGGQQVPQGQAIDLLKLFSRPQVQQETHVNVAPMHFNPIPQQSSMTVQQVDLLRLFGK